MRDVVLSSSVLILAILAIRVVAKGKISAKLQYALWLLVMVRLMVPGTIGSSPISVLRLVQLSADDVSEVESADVTDASLNSQTIGSIVSDTNAGISVHQDGDTKVYTDKNTEENTLGSAGMDTPGNAGETAGINDGITDSEAVFRNVADNMDKGSYDGKKTGTEAGFSFVTTAKTVLYGIWIIGIVIMNGYMLLYQIRFAKYLAAHRKPLHSKLTSCVHSGSLEGRMAIHTMKVRGFHNKLTLCVHSGGLEGRMAIHTMKVRGFHSKNGQYRGLQVYTVEGLPSPCLCGKCIYLDGEIVEDERKLNHILAHEYCHYRQFDPFWAVIRCMLVSVYWFHPLVWAAVYASKQDSEMACDEAAIGLLGEEERYAYGRTLLSLACGRLSGGLSVGAVLTMGSSEKRMRERIGRIAKRPKHLIIAGSLVLGLAAVVAVITFTGAKQETERELLSEAVPESGEELAGADLEAEDEEVLEDLKLRLTEEKEAVEEETRKSAEMRQAIAEEEARLKAEVSAAQEAQAMQESAEVIELLSPYDEVLLSVKGEGSENSNVIVRSPSELWKEYHRQGENAIKEGLYRLASWDGKEGQSQMQSESAIDDDIISVYGLYTEEYGLRGVKIVVGEGTDKDVSNFDIPWSFLGDSRVHVFETALGDTAPDGLPRTFAFKQLVPGSEEAYMNYGLEAHELYLCDRYDTGHIELNRVSEGDFILQMKNRITCKVNQEEQRVYIYDNGSLVGTISTSEISDIDQYPIKDAAIDTDHIDFVLGSRADNIWIHTSVVLQIQPNGSENVLWHHGLPAIAFPIDCGYFGPDREFTLGKATVNTSYVANARVVYMELLNEEKPESTIVE